MRVVSTKQVPAKNTKDQVTHSTSNTNTENPRTMSHKRYSTFFPCTTELKVTSFIAGHNLHDFDLWADVKKLELHLTFQKTIKNQTGQKKQKLKLGTLAKSSLVFCMPHYVTRISLLPPKSLKLNMFLFIRDTKIFTLKLYTYVFTYEWIIEGT